MISTEKSRNRGKELMIGIGELANEKENLIENQNPTRKDDCLENRSLSWDSELSKFECRNKAIIDRDTE